MFCVKCGRETRESSVFCETCLADMEKYPVKPSITVQIPNRPAAPSAKKKQKPYKYIKPEEQIRQLKTRTRWLSLMLAISFAAFLLASAMILWLLEQWDMDSDLGQNYGTVGTSQSAAGNT